MKKILLHRASIDNAGHYQDAGTTLTIAEGSEPGVIAAERANELLGSHGAVPVPAATAVKTA
jgi:hypothetical protein